MPCNTAQRQDQGAAHSVAGKPETPLGATANQCSDSRVTEVVKTKVLVIDDDPLLLRVLPRALRNSHEVLSANRAVDALPLLEEHRDLAVIVSDYGMPGMTGVELLRHAIEKVPNANRILMSGGGEFEAFRDVIDECRLYTFMPKPFEMQAFRVVIQRAAEHHLLSARNHALVSELQERAATEQALRRSFQQYVPAEVVNDMVGGADALTQGVERVVTVLLADLRGFTRFSENRSPHEVVRILNRFFAAMARPLLEHGGTIDKYIGDSILAHFGGVDPDSNAPNRALLAARDMRRELRQLNREFLAEGLPELRFGVGLHTGRCIIGNVGCAARMDYTIIGDTVNLTARVEELTKSRPDSILFTESTRNALSIEADIKSLGRFDVRGRLAQAELFELLD